VLDPARCTGPWEQEKLPGGLGEAGGWGKIRITVGEEDCLDGEGVFKSSLGKDLPGRVELPECLEPA
jgi:hypothetical protein